MKILKNNNVKEEMDKEFDPAIIINPKEKIKIETLDCNGEYLFGRDKKLSNPATGPIGIKGCEKGDLLKIHIHNINVKDQGFVMTSNKFGYLKDNLDKSINRKIKIKDNKAILNENIKIPINPMIGVIGVAPDEKCDNITPKSHGGNMDCKIITEKSFLYLRSNVKYGNISLGDLHASMGDGEVCVSGLEISGEVILSVEIIKDKKFKTPFVENDNLIATISSKPKIDKALKTATIKMHNYLVENLKIDKDDAAVLMSIAGDLKICQVVDPWKTARFEIKKNLLEKYL
ncbi:MAG: acetamidase/formamidase family protein [Bacillota bacterium]